MDFVFCQSGHTSAFKLELRRSLRLEVMGSTMAYQVQVQFYCKGPLATATEWYTKQQPVCVTFLIHTIWRTPSVLFAGDH